MASYFSNARRTKIGANATFQAAARDVLITNIYNNPESGDRVTLYGRTIRKVIDGDIVYRRLLSSEVLSVNVNAQRGGSTSSGSRVVKVKQDILRQRRLWSRILSAVFKPQGRTSTSRASAESQVVKLKKMVQTAEIHGCPGIFTAITLEPVDENDRDKFEEIAKSYLEAMMSWRSALLVQVFAVAESSALTLIVHDELANGDEFTALYWEKDMIVFYYILYTRTLAIQSLRNDRAMRFLVSTRWEDWSFNLKMLSWHYDLAAISLNPPHEQDLPSLFNPLPPLCQETLPRLNTPEISTYIEETFGDVLYLIVSVEQRWITDLSRYARHGLLTFGTVINDNKPGILAHHSSTPSPEWFCYSCHPDVKATLSRSGRVDLAFHKTADLQVHLKFGLRIPINNHTQLCCAYLYQSLRLYDDSDDTRNLVYIIHVGFNLRGTFVNYPTTCNLPAYLFVPPLRTEVINNLYCIRHPLPQSLFYWAHDPQGRSVIAEADWKKFGIPELRVEEVIGSYWDKEEYTMVQDHLRRKNYDLDGGQYARERGYPELVFADPHDTARIEEFEA
ncbi:hypothetical protein PQX77_021284 [Marasmius sp. AFHP31]|nr:hypothetical protein PQX77_021284 [Marasmius sp. AFHP31]